MKPRSLPVVAALSLAAACSSTRVHTDHDPAAPFGRYRTYALVEGQIVFQGVVGEHLLVRDRIGATLSRELASKGLYHDQSDPDLIVIYNARARDWHEYRTDWDRSGAERVFRRTRSEGEITVEVMDVDTRKLVWRGAATAEDDRMRSRRFVAETVHKLMARYPSRPPAG